MCGFSNMVCKVLTAYGVDFQSRDVLSDPDIREGVKKYSQWPTIPQVPQQQSNTAAWLSTDLASASACSANLLRL